MNYGFGQPMYGQQGYYQQPMGQLEQLRAQYQPQNMAQSMQTMQQPVVQQEPNNGGLIWVQGEAGAKSYMVARGNSVLLLDSEAHNFYIKSTDASGMPSMRAFSYAEITQGPKTAEAPVMDYVTRSELNTILAPLIERLESAPTTRKKAKEVNADADPAV